MLKFLFILFLINPIILITQTKKENSVSPSNINFEIIENGNGMIPTDTFGDSSQLFTIKNEEEWNDFNNKMENIDSFISAYSTDFDKYIIIALFTETENSGGYSVNISNIVLSDDNYVIISANETTPGDNCINPTVITKPYIIVQLEKSNYYDFQFNISKMKSLPCD